MSISTVNQYQIYCITEGAFVKGFGTALPTVCYTNDTHTVGANSAQLIQTISSSQVSIKQNQSTTGTNFFVKDIKFTNVESQTTQSVDYTFDILTSVYNYDFFVDDTNVGDYFTINVRPNTALGLVTQDINIGDTTLHGSAGLLMYGRRGYEIKITDGTNTDDLGRILSIDTGTGIVTFTNATTHEYSAANTNIIMNYYVMKNYTIAGYGQVRYGDNIFAAATVPAGTTVRYTYQNNSVSGDLTDKPKNFSLSFSAQF
jgi:hypothetical protein